MAFTSHHSVTEFIRNDFLTCHICFEVFTDPRILPCLHTYCFTCICTHVETAKSDGRPAVCPECREPIADNITSLKTNFFINGLAEVVKVKSEKTLNCTACNLKGTESAAKEKCLDCGDYLCSACSYGHNASSLTWKHEKIPLDEIKQGTYDEKLRQLQKIQCQKHDDKDVEYYCVTCSQPICLTCVLINHRDHKCQTVSEAITQRKASIVSLTENIREKLSNLEEKESRVQSTLDLEKRKKEEKILAIEQEIQFEISKLVAKKEAAIEKLTEKSVQAEKEQECLLEEVQIQKAVVGSCLNFCDNILKKGRDEEILMLERMIIDRLGQLQRPTLRTSEIAQKKDLQTGDTEDSEERKENAAIKIVKSEKQSIHSGSETITEMIEKFKVVHQANPPPQVEENIKLCLKLSNIFMSHHESDTTTPEIKGMAYSFQIGLVLSDKANKKLKIYSTDIVLKKCITMDNFIPFAVAIAGDIIGVISVNYLHLLKETGQLVRKILIHSKKPWSPHFTYALTASNDEFIVGNIPDESKLRIYNLDGTIKKLISCPIQFPLRSLSMTPSSHIVLCDWGMGYVKIVTRTGHVTTRCKRLVQWKPNDACVSKDETVFVADYDLASVCVFDKSGRLLLEHSTASDGIKPVGVVFDDQERLYVAGKRGYVSRYNIEHNL